MNNYISILTKVFVSSIIAFGVFFNAELSFAAESAEEVKAEKIEFVSMDVKAEFEAPEMFASLDNDNDDGYTLNELPDDGCEWTIILFTAYCTSSC